MTMPTILKEARRAEMQEEIQPLIELCKAGKLFEIQEWIAAGKVVNSPIYASHRASRRSPLEIAVERGFHSLVNVLLKGGAAIEGTGYDGPVEKALDMRRLDLIQLFVEHGYDVKSASMERVFATWAPQIIEFFIDNGANVEDGNPLAWALCCRNRTALGIFKKYKDRFPGFQEQANIALRHNCKEGNMKWVSLLLWAGADPYAPGSDNYQTERDDEERGLSALGYAALWRHFEVFRMKRIRLDPKHPVAREVMRYIGCEEGFEVLRDLLEKGMDPNDRETGGCSAIPSLLNLMAFDVSIHPRDYFSHFSQEGDSAKCRGKIKLIHLLAKHGARWVPKDASEINAVRKSLLKLAPDYTVEFVWIMAKYQACSQPAIAQLLHTPTITKHVSGFSERLAELMATMESGVTDAQPILHD
jgi:hypothetical protein